MQDKKGAHSSMRIRKVGMVVMVVEKKRECYFFVLLESL